MFMPVLNTETLILGKDSRFPSLEYEATAGTLVLLSLYLPFCLGRFSYPENAK